MTDLTPPQIILDDYQQLITDALLHTYTVSDGAFSEFSSSDVTPAFLSAIAYAGSELLYKANKASEAAAKSFLANVVGITEETGTKALTTIQFGLTTTLVSDFLIPGGFEITTTSTEKVIRFYTTEDFIIPAGQNTGTITAIAEEIGEDFNLAAGLLSNITSPLTYLQYAINIEPATGGKDPETIENLIERSAQVLRLRNPVSAQDFEEFAQLILGDGARAKCIGKLGKDLDLSNPQPGVIHLFLLDKDGLPASLDAQGKVGNALSPRLLLGTILYTSPLELFNVSVDLIAKSFEEKPLELLAQELYTALTDYLSYKIFPIGKPVLIEEIKYVLRSVGGFTIGHLHLNDLPVSVPNPNQWSLAKLGYFSVSIVNDQGTVTYNNTFFEEQPGVE